MEYFSWEFRLLWTLWNVGPYFRILHLERKEQVAHDFLLDLQLRALAQLGLDGAVDDLPQVRLVEVWLDRGGSLRVKDQRYYFHKVVICEQLFLVFALLHAQYQFLKTRRCTKSKQDIDEFVIIQAV